MCSEVIEVVNIGKSNVTMMLSVIGIHTLLAGENDETAAPPVSTTKFSVVLSNDHLADVPVPVLPAMSV